MDVNEIKETLKAAEIYMKSLKTLKSELEDAESQIITTTNESSTKVEVIFTTLLEKITKSLENRKKDLLSNIKNIQDESTKPLKDCCKVILEKIDATSKLLELGANLNQNSNRTNLQEFNIKSRLLGSLPEVPELKEVPFVTIQYEPNIENDLLEICSNIGEISRIAPIQISSVVERPGSLLVEWKIGDCDERSGDIQEFRLQRAFGNVVKDKQLVVNFTDCYVGTENQYLVKDIQPFQEYSFRVCCKYEGSDVWSQWSLPQVSSTYIKRFSWKSDENFEQANENTIAKCKIPGNTILLSDGPQFKVGYSVEFTFLECDNNLSKQFVGLTTNSKVKDLDAIKEESFILEVTGDIFVNGILKATKLPVVSKGSKVHFTCDSVHDEKLRINVDSGDKRVTYDWSVSSEEVYFLGVFNTPKLKIMVE